MWASYRGRIIIVQELLDRGANPNAKADVSVLFTLFVLLVCGHCVLSAVPTGSPHSTCTERGREGERKMDVGVCADMTNYIYISALFSYCNVSSA